MKSQTHSCSSKSCNLLTTNRQLEPRFSCCISLLHGNTNHFCGTTVCTVYDDIRGSLCCWTNSPYAYPGLSACEQQNIARTTNSSSKSNNIKSLQIRKKGRWGSRSKCKQTDFGSQKFGNAARGSEKNFSIHYTKIQHIAELRGKKKETAIS